MWYASMGTLQILLFGLIAIKIKINAPGAHTMPEIVFSRHGKVAHATYLFFGLATNLLVGAILVLGGSQVIEAVTGMNAYAGAFLIPTVVALYVIAGRDSAPSLPKVLSVDIFLLYARRFALYIYSRLHPFGHTFHCHTRLQFPG